MLLPTAGLDLFLLFVDEVDRGRKWIAGRVAERRTEVLCLLMSPTGQFAQPLAHRLAARREAESSFVFGHGQVLLSQSRPEPLQELLDSLAAERQSGQIIERVEFTDEYGGRVPINGQQPPLFPPKGNVTAGFTNQGPVSVAVGYDLSPRAVVSGKQGSSGLGFVTEVTVESTVNDLHGHWPAD